jgi:hypothetical protein
VQLALGLVSVFAGVAVAIAGYTKRPVSRLLFGYWDKPGTTVGPSAPAELPAAQGANAATGGVHAPMQPNPRAGTLPGERPG